MYCSAKESNPCFQIKSCFLGQVSVFSLQALQGLYLTLSHILTRRRKVNKKAFTTFKFTHLCMMPALQAASSWLLPRRTPPASIFCHLKQNWPYTTTLTKFLNDSLHSPPINKTPITDVTQPTQTSSTTTLQGDILGPIGESNSPAHPSGP